MNQKFLIVDNKLIYSIVNIHSELLPEKYEKILGGGYWNIRKKFKTIYFYGTSDEFNSISFNDLKNIKNTNCPEYLKEYIWKYSKEKTFEKALINNLTVL